jgi:atypical dual specificity phosphatase
MLPSGGYAPHVDFVVVDVGVPGVSESPCARPHCLSYMPLRRRIVIFPQSISPPIVSTSPLHNMLSNKASEVLPRLYLTDIFTALDEAKLTSLGITHVVSVIEGVPNLPQTQPLCRLHIPLSDNSDQDILTHFPVANSFISNALTEDPNSRVLVSSSWLLRLSPLFLITLFFIQVHCAMGISRSATIVCAYLIATMRMTPDEALAAVKKKREIVCPNLGFLRQLEEYSVQLYGERAKPPAKIGEKVAQIIRWLTRDATPKFPTRA